MANGMRDGSDQEFSILSIYYAGFALLVASPVLCVLGMDGRSFIVLATASVISCACVLTLCKSEARASFVYKNKNAVWMTVLLVLSAISPLVLPLGGYFGQVADGVLQIVVGLLMGSGFALLVLFWYSVGGRLLGGLDDVGFHRTVLVSFAIACACMILSSAFRGTLLLALCSAVFLVSVLLNRFAVSKVLGKEADRCAFLDGSRKGPEMPSQHAGYPVLMGTVCGAVAVSAMPVVGLSASFAIIGTAGVAACVVVYVAMRSMSQPPSFYEMERVAVPLAFPVRFLCRS